jgi:hypothetical protein
MKDFTTTGVLLLFVISYLAPYIDHNYWSRLASLILGVLAAKTGTAIICPLIAIAFKWIVIGRYKVGTYPLYVFIFLHISTIFTL